MYETNKKKILINWWMNEWEVQNRLLAMWLGKRAKCATDWLGKMASTWAETSHILHPKEGERQHRSVKFVPWLEYNKTYLKIDNETNNFWNGAEEGSYLK